MSETENWEKEYDKQFGKYFSTEKKEFIRQTIKQEIQKAFDECIRTEGYICETCENIEEIKQNLKNYLKKL